MYATSHSLLKTFHRILIKGHSAWPNNLKIIDCLLSDRAAFPADLSPQALVQFLEDGGTILLAGSTNLSEYWRDFGQDFDVDFDDQASLVVVNFHHLDHDPLTTYTSIETNLLIEDQIVIPPSLRSTNIPVLFRGIGHAVGKNPLVMSVLRASPLA
ncbi:oligosaccharyl transferase glycoprotein complex, beta subunit [Puccinia graminis f. sp. tritici]|uniref:Dolichyl-diphosphooligosaccharide--protein glycosyltransferase subunit WBP1 n=1 Tax=Puccinia graminis f. sp. tritici TaxID=56615 RepID=A0A5B0RMS2_PUCGR|nr:oligosaccharyl transferase glycoprotein complex, beta subunit [Puccinia graminis f. sp. tritici]